MSALLDICDAAAARLLESGVLPAGTAVVVHRQKNEGRKIEAAVGKQKGGVLLYPTRAGRAEGTGPGAALALELALEIYTAPHLRGGGTPAADLAEMVFDALDGWAPGDGSGHLYDEVECRSAELVPDDEFLIWRVEAVARRFLTDNP